MGDEIAALWNEVRELSIGSKVEKLSNPPSSLQFLREFVSPNKPCIISNAISHWPALSLWPSLSYLTDNLSDSIVSLHLTPDGRADSLVQDSADSTVFASAFVDRVPFSRAIDLILSNGFPVAYLQQQNDCFRTEYGAVSADCDEHIPWASDAFGCLPEAVNLWIGNSLSTTSFHKDNYENLYAVVSGEKHFLLLPPCDFHRLYIKPYPAAGYSHEDGKLRLVTEEPLRYVPWCSVDPYPSSENREREIKNHPLYFDGPKPLECTVKAGEVLYLPSLWFHHVRQSPDEHGRAIAVNYWYDMQYDVKFAYFNFLQSLKMESPR